MSEWKAQVKTTEKEGQMCEISQGQSCDQTDQDNVVVTNKDPTKNGSYQITGDGISINKQISGGEMQTTKVHRNPVTVTNSGKPILAVANCVPQEA